MILSYLGFGNFSGGDFCETSGWKIIIDYGFFFGEKPVDYTGATKKTNHQWIILVLVIGGRDYITP